MGKRKFLGGLMALAFGLGCFLSIKESKYDDKESSCSIDSVESLSNCEVFDNSNNLMVNCRGENGVCWQYALGNGMLYCSGTRVN